MGQNKIVQLQDQKLAGDVGRMLIEKGLTLATAESCTGGAIGALLTGLAGSSSWFSGGVISYSNSVKTNLLGVAPSLIENYGAVSQEVVEAMAKGGRKAMGTDLCVAVSGIAGPAGGSVEKPIGTVWVAWCDGNNAVTSKLYQLSGDRHEVQKAAVRMALAGIIG